MKKALYLALIFGLAAVAVSAQSLGNGVMVAESNGYLRWSQCAFGPDGVLHIVYGDELGAGDTIWYVTYNGTTASTPFALSSPGMRGERPNVAVSRRGVVVAAWGTIADKSIYMRVYDPKTAAWGAVEAVKIGYGYEEPMPAIDTTGDIIIFWSDEAGRAYTRAKIGGVWEPERRMNSEYGKQGGVAIGQDGWIWAVWREKLSGNYKNFYAKRTKTSSWSTRTILVSTGGSSSHPNITIGPNNTPVVVWGDIDEALENGSEVKLIRPEVDSVREVLIPFAMQHFPRVAVDSDNKIHVAVQLGGGDYGDGLRYIQNVAGAWSPIQTVLSSYPKLPGIAADPFGNVAACQCNVVLSTNKSQVYVWSRTPIAPHYFYAPLNPTSTIKIATVRRSPGVTYNLSWSANPQNNDADLQGYAIYVKEGTGAYQPLLTVSKTTFSAELKFTDLSKKRRFAVATVAQGGGESEPVEF
jgi:hypothetical protein